MAEVADLSDSELAVIIVEKVMGAKDALDILETNDVVGFLGLKMVWKILRHAHAKLTGEKFDGGTRPDHSMDRA